MSTTLFKKLFLYWFIIVGLWSFGFTQFGGPSIWNSGTPNYSCNTSNDCTVKMIYQCYDAGIQCVNNTSKEWSWWRDPMCSLLGLPLRKEPTKYDVKIIDCWCVNNKCTPKKINKTITNSRIIYKAKKIWIMFLIIVLCTSIPLIIGYKVYKKLKKQKLLPQFQPITQDNWVVVPAPKVIVSGKENQIDKKQIPQEESSPLIKSYDLTLENLSRDTPIRINSITNNQEEIDPKKQYIIFLIVGLIPILILVAKAILKGGNTLLFASIAIFPSIIYILTINRKHLNMGMWILVIERIVHWVQYRDLNSSKDMSWISLIFLTPIYIILLLMWNSVIRTSIDKDSESTIKTNIDKEKNDIKKEINKKKSRAHTILLILFIVHILIPKLIPESIYNILNTLHLYNIRYIFLIIWVVNIIRVYIQTSKITSSTDKNSPTSNI